MLFNRIIILTRKQALWSVDTVAANWLLFIGSAIVGVAGADWCYVRI